MSDPNNSPNNDTLTFVNEEMTYEEVKKIFAPFGEIKNMNKYHKRFFVQFENPKDAQKAQTELKRNFRVTFAHAKSRPRPKKNFRAEGKLIRFWNPEDLPTTGYSVSALSSEARGMAMIENYIKTTGRNRNTNASARSEMAKHAENRRAFGESYENLVAIEKAFENESKKAGKQAQRGKPANPKPGTSKMVDPELFSSDDNIEKPKAEKPKAEKPKAEKPKAENRQAEEEVENIEAAEGEEDSLAAQVHALSDGGRRKVRTEGFEEIINALGNEMPFSVIVANIPAKYTLNEVYDLVEEVKPIAFSEMDYSIKMRVKFCEVFVNDAGDVNYLKQKLNDFVICGKQLTVMEPAEILDETRWSA